MKIVGIAACTSEIPDVYIVKEKLVTAALALGHEVHIETQGTTGCEDELTEQQIKEADIVIIAADIKVSGKDRFNGKRIVEIPTHIAINSSKSIISKLHEEINK